MHEYLHDYIPYTWPKDMYMYMHMYMRVYKYMYAEGREMGGFGGVGVYSKQTQ